MLGSSLSTELVTPAGTTRFNIRSVSNKRIPGWLVSFFKAFFSANTTILPFITRPPVPIIQVKRLVVWGAISSIVAVRAGPSPLIFPNAHAALPAKLRSSSFNASSSADISLSVADPLVPSSSNAAIRTAGSSSLNASVRLREPATLLNSSAAQSP